MSEDKADPVSLDPYGRNAAPRASGIEVLLVLVSLGWLGLCWVLLFGGTLDGVDTTDDGVTLAVITFLPLAVLWLMARALRRLQALESENARLSAALSALRQSLLDQQQALTTARSSLPSSTVPPPAPSVDAPRAETAICAATTPQQTEPQTPMATDASEASPAPMAASAQADLPLGQVPITEWPPMTLLLRALNFPEDAQDRDGFAALRRAKANPQLADLLQAAEDILTILSQDGVYVDDLSVAPPDPALWRAFASGERGHELSDLGAVRDPAALDRVAQRMREDMIFRDAALHFLLRFDKMLARLARDCQDADLTALSTTRTARGFMLLARAAGSFDG